jgi:hypothetical protein
MCSSLMRTLTRSAALSVHPGVNWGPKPRLAARCAVYGALHALHHALAAAPQDLPISSLELYQVCS